MDAWECGLDIFGQFLLVLNLQIEEKCVDAPLERTPAICPLMRKERQRSIRMHVHCHVSKVQKMCPG